MRVPDTCPSEAALPRLVCQTVPRWDPSGAQTRDVCVAFEITSSPACLHGLLSWLGRLRVAACGNASLTMLFLDLPVSPWQPLPGGRVGWGSCAAGPPRGYCYVSPPRMRVSREPRATDTRISLHPSPILHTRGERPLLRCSVVAQLRQCTGARERVPSPTPTSYTLLLLSRS